jgi:hypothetical protein
VRSAAPFLTDEYLADSGSPLIVRRTDALQVAGAGTRANFIFHSAYCCSTLLANAYDWDGGAFSLKEPVILNDLVGWRHQGAPPAKVGEVLGDALKLLARPFRPGEACVIKPSNVVNGLAPAMVAARPEAGVLLLNAPLDVYLGSIASKGLWGRLWVRELLLKLLTDKVVDLGFEPNDYFLQTDLQVAAVGWLAQHLLFQRIAAAWPDRVRTLDSETLLARPADALSALDSLFGTNRDDEARAVTVATIFRRHAKSGAEFSATDRQQDQKAAASLHAEEIEKVALWARTVADKAGVDMDSRQPLLG